MLAMAVVALVVLAVFFRQHVGRNAWLLMGIAATIAFAVAFGITKM
jgi:hypothetical protein